jgi:hypothetical protein
MSAAARPGSAHADIAPAMSSAAVTNRGEAV